VKARAHFEEEHAGVELPCGTILKYKKRGSPKHPDGTTDHRMYKRLSRSEMKASENTIDGSVSKIDCDNSRRIST
jgi:hypothetical protein